MRTYLALSALVLATSAAHAQSDASAGALFDRGLADMKAKNFEKGCPALAESHRLDPRLGTLFTLAECEAQWGKIASAVAHYRDFVAAVKRLEGSAKKAQARRLEVASAEAERLGPDVPLLSVALPSGAPADASVELDGIALGRAALEAPIPVNPGTRKLTLRLADGRTTELSVELARGAKQAVTLAMPEQKPAASPAPAPALSAGASPAAVPSPPPPQAERSSANRTWGGIALGVGAVGLAAGATFGVLAWRSKSSIEDNCSGPDCNQDGLDAADRGQRWALLSTIGFGIGIAGVGTGVVLLTTGAPSQKTGAAPRGVALSGNW